MPRYVLPRTTVSERATSLPNTSSVPLPQLQRYRCCLSYLSVDTEVLTGRKSCHRSWYAARERGSNPDPSPLYITASVSERPDHRIKRNALHYMRHYEHNTHYQCICYLLHPESSLIHIGIIGLSYTQIV